MGAFILLGIFCIIYPPLIVFVLVILAIGIPIRIVAEICHEIDERIRRKRAEEKEKAK